MADGTVVNYSVTFKYDGHEYPATGAPYDFVSVKRINGTTTTFSTRKSDGKYRMTGQSVVSKDGKTLTQKYKGVDAQGKPVVSTLVFNRQ